MCDKNGRLSQEAKSVTVRGVVLEADKPTPSPFGGLDIYSEDVLRKFAKDFNSEHGEELLHVENGQLIYDGPIERLTHKSLTKHALLTKYARKDLGMLSDTNEDDDHEPCPHPFLSRRTAGTTFDEPSWRVNPSEAKNLRTFVWCEACGALGVQKDGKLEVEWRLPEVRS